MMQAQTPMKLGTQELNLLEENNPTNPILEIEKFQSSKELELEFGQGLLHGRRFVKGG